MNFQSYWNELLAHIPSLSPFLAQRFVNRAWRDIRQKKSWSFLLAEGYLIVPTVITAGTISATQYSKTITPDATALAAFNLAGSHPLIGERQFRLSAGSRIYNIDTWDGATLALKEEYQEATVAGSTYSVLSVYFKAPSTDFIRFISIRDLTTNYFVKLHLSQEEINRIDPQRSTSGDPMYCADYKTGIDGVPWYEFYPTPTSQRSYSVLYQKRGSDFSSPSETLPGVIPESLLIDLALYYAYRWAETAKGPNGPNIGADWRYSAAEAKASFEKQLVTTIREDEDMYLTTINRSHSTSGYSTPIDANYAQNHSVDWT